MKNVRLKLRMLKNIKTSQIIYMLPEDIIQ